MELLHFAGLFVLTNLCFGGVVAAFLLGRNDRLQLPAWPLILIGLGLGPFLTTVVLYYALVFWHGIPPVLLLLLPVLFFVGLSMSARDGWLKLKQAMLDIPRALRDRSLWLFLLGSAFILFIAVIFLVNKSLVDHDVLEYGVQGKIFLRDLAIVYQQHHFDLASGFYYVGLHGFSFPLLFTWEGLTASFVDIRSDLWVRSMTMWYGWLLIAFLWSIVRRIDRWMAVASSIAVAVPVGFLFLVTIYHLDSYRIFFFTVALAGFVALLQAPSWERLILFSVLCGAQAFIHSVGAILAGTLCLVLLLFLPFRWGKRAAWVLCAAAVMLAVGAVHYVADVFLGTGWIFQDIIWY